MQEFRKKQQHHEGPETLVTLRDPIRPESTDSNPFGFIRYMDKADEPFPSSLSKSKYVEDKQEEIVSYNNDDMTFLLPKSLWNHVRLSYPDKTLLSPKKHHPQLLMLLGAGAFLPSMALILPRLLCV